MPFLSNVRYLTERFVGKKFGKLTVVSFSHRNSHSQTYWNCKCACGKTKIVRGCHLLNNATRSCGCGQRGTGNTKWKGCGEIGGWTWNNCRIHAAKRGIKFSITVKDMWHQFVRQRRKCALTGELLQFSQLNQCDWKNITASLDRIESSKGYTKSNIQWVHKRVNRMKMGLNQNEFIRWCRAVAEFHVGS